MEQPGMEREGHTEKQDIEQNVSLPLPEDSVKLKLVLWCKIWNALFSVSCTEAQGLPKSGSPGNLK